MKIHKVAFHLVSLAVLAITAKIKGLYVKKCVHSLGIFMYVSVCVCVCACALSFFKKTRASNPNYIIS